MENTEERDPFLPNLSQEPLKTPDPHNTTPDPFSPMQAPARREEHPLARPRRSGETFQMVDDQEKVWECKMESGVLVKMRALGSVKERVRVALANAALSSHELSEDEILLLTHLERGAYRLARAAGSGGEGYLHAFETLLDRLIGKPKQYSESTAVKLNVDAELTAEETPTDITPAPGEFTFPEEQEG